MGSTSVPCDTTDRRADLTILLEIELLFNISRISFLFYGKFSHYMYVIPLYSSALTQCSI